MPPADRVVANTSPLLNLALVERLDLLETQFSSVLVPEQVWDELTEDGVDELDRGRGIRAGPDGQWATPYKL